ncbi:MAG: sugar ABC transporter ATP-binding protein [Planctomycetes bacterium]|nr:sugar ABC transporter ATP-binding protein [Planctomycetota bacterium]
MTAPRVEFRWVDKSFGGVRALAEVSLTVVAGEVHAWLGESGAGKSTLARILAGDVRAERGELRLDGEVVRFASPAEALAAGVAWVAQEPGDCAELSVAESVTLGRAPHFLGLVSRSRANMRARDALSALGVELDPRRVLRELSRAERQLVALAAALDRDPRVLILDEPTERLDDRTATALRERIRELARRGTSVIWSTRHASEARELADHVSVLRDGRLVHSFKRGDADDKTLVAAMLGRSLAPARRTSVDADAPVALAVEGLSSHGQFEGAHFEARASEIVALGENGGAVLAVLAGVDERARGAVTVDGRSVKLGRVARAIEHGLVFVPADLERDGLVANLGVRENWSLGIARRFTTLGWSSRTRATQAATASLARLRVHRASLEAPITTLSAGERRKLAFCRALERDVRVLLLDRPTRGVDVATRVELHELVRAVAASGRAVLFTPTDDSELRELATREQVSAAV